MFVLPKKIEKATEEFLFEYDNRRDAETLKPGVTFSYAEASYEVIRIYPSVQAEGIYSFFVVIRNL